MARSLPPTSCAMIVVASHCPSLSVTQWSALGVRVTSGSAARTNCCATASGTRFLCSPSSKTSRRGTVTT
eukprot:2198910-Alexandrium_andersonii.AAC.1